jgi:hypothetical protein
VNAAAKDAELYLRRCRKLEGVIADLWMALENAWGDLYLCSMGEGNPMEAIAEVRAAIAKTRGEV